MSAIDLAGKLIAFEGIDASGKSTQAQRLVQRLAAAGLDVVSTGEPGGTPIGEAVRRVLLAPEHVALLPFSELLLFMVSRAQNTQEVILPALRQGKTVVASRYRMSSLAYQGYGRGVDLDLIRALNERATEGVCPDLTIIVDVPAETAIGRKKANRDRIEVEAFAFHHRVRQGFLSMAKCEPNVTVIDGTQDADSVERAVVAELERRFCRCRE